MLATALSPEPIHALVSEVKKPPVLSGRDKYQHLIIIRYLLTGKGIDERLHLGGDGQDNARTAFATAESEQGFANLIQDGVNLLLVDGR